MVRTLSLSHSTQSSGSSTQSLVRVSLVLANALAPLAHAQSVAVPRKRIGSLHVYDSENVMQAWVDNGANMRY